MAITVLIGSDWVWLSSRLAFGKRAGAIGCQFPTCCWFVVSIPRTCSSLGVITTNLLEAHNSTLDTYTNHIFIGYVRIFCGWYDYLCNTGGWSPINGWWVMTPRIGGITCPIPTYIFLQWTKIDPQYPWKSTTCRSCPNSKPHKFPYKVAPPPHLCLLVCN